MNNKKNLARKDAYDLIMIAARTLEAQGLGAFANRAEQLARDIRAEQAAERKAFMDKVLP